MKRTKQRYLERMRTLRAWGWELQRVLDAVREDLGSDVRSQLTDDRLILEALILAHGRGNPDAFDACLPAPRSDLARVWFIRVLAEDLSEADRRQAARELAP